MKNLTKLFVFGVFALFCFSFFTCPTAAAQESCATTSVRASHILVNSEAEALSLKTKMENGESFETLAKKYSKCPSGQAGGDLGVFERGQMVKSFEDAAFSLPAGKISNPVKTQFGWHIIKVTEIN